MSEFTVVCLTYYSNQPKILEKNLFVLHSCHAGKCTLQNAEFSEGVFCGIFVAERSADYTLEFFSHSAFRKI